MISVCYNYDAKDKTDPGYYEMKDGIPNFGSVKYGIVSGLAFTVTYAVLILFSGSLADHFNRKILLSSASLAWSATSIGTAFSQKFWQIALFRMLLGVFEAFSGPIAYSLIVDYFP